GLHQRCVAVEGGDLQPEPDHQQDGIDPPQFVQRVAEVREQRDDEVIEDGDEQQELDREPDATTWLGGSLELRELTGGEVGRVVVAHCSGNDSISSPSAATSGGCT